MHELSVRQDGYAAWWVCTCGWTCLLRDTKGQHQRGSVLAATRHGVIALPTQEGPT